MIFNFHNLSDDQIAKELMDKYQRAKTVRDQFVPLFEECYEVAFPQRKGFYTETIGERRDEKIFDEKIDPRYLSHSFDLRSRKKRKS